MNLGELEFKLEDFTWCARIDNYREALSSKNHETLLTALCELANTILREKLAKANDVSAPQAKPRTFRFTADQFYFLTDIQDSPQTKAQRNVLTKLQAHAIAAEANALLEAEEVKCEQVYGNGEIHKCEQSADCAHTRTNLLWGVEKIGEDVVLSDRDRDHLLENLETPPKPNMALKKLFNGEGEK